MTLLAFEAEDYSDTADAASAKLPKFDERIAMFASTFGGPEGIVTAAMRAAARDHILAAMAADLVDETTDFASRPQDLRVAVPTNNVAAPVTYIRPRYAAARYPAQVSIKTSAGLLRHLQDLISSLAAPFTVRRLGMAAVPLVALIVAGSVWTENRFNVTEGPDRGATAGVPPMRGIGVQPVDSAAEQNMTRAIAAEETAHGQSSPAVARKLVDLASLLRADGRNAEAQALCERALIIEDQALGPKNPETIRTVEELAAIYRAQGRTKDADAILTRNNQP